MKNSLSASLLDRFAFFISALGSPYLILATSSLLVIDTYAANRHDFLVWSSLFLTYVSIIPLVFIYAGIRSGNVTDIHVMLRQQRIGPIIVGPISSSMLTGLYALLEAPLPLLAMSLSLVVSGILSYAITRFWKISIHTASMAGSIMLTGLLVDSAYYYAFLLLPLMVWARTRRGRHSPWQTLGGAFLGTLCSYLTCLSFGLA